MASLNIYVNEPATKGKVVLHTSIGPLDVELWSKEAPLACRNFVQLGLEGYYDGCLFHRVIHQFMAQTGDPTGTGKGGESIYLETISRMNSTAGCASRIVASSGWHQAGQTRMARSSSSR